MSPRLLLTPGDPHVSWEGTQCDDGGTGWARWHLGIVICLAPVLGGVSECHQGCYVSQTWVAQDTSQGHRAPWMSPCPS